MIVSVVGKVRHRALADAIHDYETRAARYWPLEIREVREEPARGSSALLVRKREAERLGDAVGSARMIACEVSGAAMTSEGFSAWLQSERETGRDVAFVIGGAYGLAPELSARAERLLSLSPLTMPHELARLVLAEQLYRAGTLVKREPYHK